MQTPQTQALSPRIIALAHAPRRFGYRRLHDLLRPEFPNVNHKRVYRLYRDADLAVRRPKKARRSANERQSLAVADAPNAVWRMVFVSDALAKDRRLKCLTVVDHGMSGACLARILHQAARIRGHAKAVRTDDGPELTSRTFIAWAQQHEIEHKLIEPGKPLQNVYIESFNGKFTDECQKSIG